MDRVNLPGLKRTAFLLGIWTASPVLGLRPMPVLRRRTPNTLNPRSPIRSPRPRADFIVLKIVSTAVFDCNRLRPERMITRLTIFRLVLFRNRDS